MPKSAPADSTADTGVPDSELQGGESRGPVLDVSGTPEPVYKPAEVTPFPHPTRCLRRNAWNWPLWAMTREPWWADLERPADTPGGTYPCHRPTYPRPRTSPDTSMKLAPGYRSIILYTPTGLPASAYRLRHHLRYVFGLYAGARCWNKTNR